MKKLISPVEKPLQYSSCKKAKRDFLRNAKLISEICQPETLLGRICSLAEWRPRKEVIFRMPAVGGWSRASAKFHLPIDNYSLRLIHTYDFEVLCDFKVIRSAIKIIFNLHFRFRRLLYPSRLPKSNM